jgi:hypothetical protein
MRGIPLLGGELLISGKEPYLMKLINALIMKSFPLLFVMQAIMLVPKTRVPNCCCKRKVECYNVTAHYSADEKSVPNTGTSLLCVVQMANLQELH